MTEAQILIEKLETAATWDKRKRDLLLEAAAFIRRLTQHTPGA